MNKELFIETMNVIISLEEESIKFHHMMEEIDDNFGGGYIHSKSINAMIKLLAEVVGDEDKLIDYYCWEIDFGRRWVPGCITESDGTDIKLATPEDLWEALKK